MSSFELLELFGASVVEDPEEKVRTIVVEFAPEDGALARSLRENGYTRLENMVAEGHNEIARLRASYHAMQGGKKAAYEPFLFIDPRIAKVRDEKKRENAEFQKEVEADLFGPDW